jgi:hypothetical protein
MNLKLCVCNGQTVSLEHQRANSRRQPSRRSRSATPMTQTVSCRRPTLSYFGHFYVLSWCQANITQKQEISARRKAPTRAFPQVKDWGRLTKKNALWRKKGLSQCPSKRHWRELFCPGERRLKGLFSCPSRFLRDSKRNP